MRLAIIADIHGNSRALDAVIADISKIGVDRIVSLGDNIGYGPEPEEVVRTLQGYRVLSVMGNHELALISRSYFQRLHANARQSLLTTRCLLSEQSLAWLEQLPPVRCLFGARFVHGCPPQSMTVYLHNPTATRLQRLFGEFKERCCFCRPYPHLWLVRQHPGEGAVPRGKTGPEAARSAKPLPHPSGECGPTPDTLGWQAKYLFWDQEAELMDLRAVDYDVQTTIHLIKERGFPLVNAQRLYW